MWVLSARTYFSQSCGRETVNSRMADFGPDGLCLRFGRRGDMAAAAGIETAAVNAPTS
jgi:hypothetical protein